MASDAYQQAKAAFDAADWSQASAQFTTLYQAKQTPELNRYLAMSLFQDQQFLAAEQIAAEQDEAYLINADWFERRMTIALHNQQFIFARQLCALPAANAWRTAAVARIATAEATAQRTLGATQRVIAKQFYHLGDVSLPEQQRRLQRAHQLPLDDFLKGTQYLLVDPFLHPLLRATLLAELYRLRVKMEVQVHWLDDQRHTINTADLVAVTASPAAQQAFTYLQEQIAQNNPGLAANVRQTLNLQLMLLYPFADKIMTQPRAWVDWLAGRPLDQTVSRDTQKQIESWQKRLAKHLETLFAAVNGEKSEN